MKRVALLAAGSSLVSNPAGRAAAFQAPRVVGTASLRRSSLNTLLRQSADPTMPSTTTAGEAAAQTTDARSLLVLGGDYAGIQVALDHQANLIAVPDYWIPAAMAEWGQEPDHLETIVSEDYSDESNANGQDDTEASWKRHTLTILPETGCGIDNLDVVRSSETLSVVVPTAVEKDSLNSGDGVVQCLASCIRRVPDGLEQWRLETIFQCHNNKEQSPQQPLHRVRVSVLVERSNNDNPNNNSNSNNNRQWAFSTSRQFSSPPIAVSWERQFDAESSKGTLADGGGLDGQRVNRWIGPSISKGASSFGSSNKVETTSDNYRVLHLPGNVTLSCQEDNGFSMQVGYEGNGVEWRLSDVTTTPIQANLVTLLLVSGQLVQRKHTETAMAALGSDSSSSSSNGEDVGLNELHTRLRDAVILQDFVEAGRISDIFLYKLHGDKLANGYSVGSEKEKQEKLRALRKRMSWKGLGVAPWLISRLDSLNYTFPTTIQINALESVNAILNDTATTASEESSMEERIGRSNMDMGIVISGTTGSGKTLAYLAPLLSTLSESLFTRQRLRVFAEEKVGDTAGDLADRLAIVSSPVVRSTARKQIRSGSTIATGAALSTLGKSGTDVKSPLALIVVPSRELGVQIAMDLYRLVGGVIKDDPTEFSGRQNMFKYKGPKGVRIGCVLDDEEAEFGLKLQTDVAITTPKFLGKLLNDKDIDASKLRVAVVDEADLSLETTPESTLKALFEADKNNEDGESTREYSRLTFLVGASVTEALGNLAVSSCILPPGRSYIATATHFSQLQSMPEEASTSEFLLQEPKASLKDLKLCLYPGLRHYRAQVEDDHGLLILTRLLRKELRKADEEGSEDRPRVMVFFPSEEEAKAAIEPLRDALWGEHRLCVLLPETGVSPLTILDQFRKNETSVMLATPNSVRGLDCRGLTHVYTLYLPMEDPREYVHLAGRVGRIGSYNGGNVISVLQKSKANQMDDLAKQLGFQFSDIDTESLRGAAFSKEGLESEDGGEEDVESMRRYLEDTMSLLKLAKDPYLDTAEVDPKSTTTSEMGDNNDDADSEESGTGPFQ